VAKRDLFNGINLGELVSKTEKLSGADISELIRRTLEEKVRQEGMGNSTSLVSTEDILKELENYEKIRNTRKQMGFVPQNDK
jgi:SpoVK/Ycf46/Vps4 family AAA+-type ATPase